MAKRVRANPFGIIVIIILLAVIGVLSWRLEKAEAKCRHSSGPTAVNDGLLLNSNLDAAIYRLADAVRRLLQQLRFPLSTVIQFLRIDPVSDKFVAHSLRHAFRKREALVLRHRSIHVA